MSTDLVEIDWSDRPVSIEFRRVGADDAHKLLIVFLHEGLGSVTMWRDFPDRLCAAAGCRGIVYSRPGYGRSTPRAPLEHWAPDFMHRQAFEVLPAVLRALSVDPDRERPWLFGHSDGGTISLLHAARFPDSIGGAIVVAPHILVEPVSVAAITAAREAYREGGLKARLARYHDDPDSAFHGWCDAWLDPAFRRWSIQGELGAIRCPLLAVQGLGDEYGTLEQIRGIAREVPAVTLLEMADCGHSPHRDQPRALIAASVAFLKSIRS